VIGAARLLGEPLDLLSIGPDPTAPGVEQHTDLWPGRIAGQVEAAVRIKLGRFN
jgi:hypothetical protein